MQQQQQQPPLVQSPLYCWHSWEMGPEAPIQTSVRLTCCDRGCVCNEHSSSFTSVHWSTPNLKRVFLKKTILPVGGVRESSEINWKLGSQAPRLVFWLSCVLLYKTTPASSSVAAGSQGIKGSGGDGETPALNSWLPPHILPISINCRPQFCTQRPWWTPPPQIHHLD